MPSAGEVEQFGYCAHNWLLARQGVEGDEPGAIRGSEAQARIAHAIQEAKQRQEQAERSIRRAMTILSVCGVLTIVSAGLVTLRPTTRLFLVVALTLVLLNGSAALLTLGLHFQQRARRIRQEAGLLPDLDAQGAMLDDAEWNLSGRADYILNVGDHIVPMLFKSGRTPHQPFLNHALHLVAIMRLIEVRDAKPPAYGLLSYPQGIFRIPYDEAARANLRTLLRRIEQAAVAGVADRDHDEPGRCHGCARRVACTQKLP